MTQETKQGLVIAVIALLLAAVLVVPMCALARPSCVPLFCGDLVDHRAERKPPGWVLWCGCRLDFSARGFGCVHGQCLAAGGLSARVLDFLLATDRERAARDGWTQHVTGDCKAATGDFAVVCQQLQDRLLNPPKPSPTPAPTPTPTPKPTLTPSPTPPPVATWVVASTTIYAAEDKDASGKCIHLPSFAWDGRARGAVGSTCIAGIGVGPHFGSSSPGWGCVLPVPQGLL